MREIKFRVWNMKHKYMHYSHRKDGSLNPLFNWSVVFEDYAEDPNTIKMQYTGLKDKDGTEIYEGDILKVPIDINKEYHGGYVIKEVLNKQGVWIASYVNSEKITSIPRGYMAGFLLDNFDYDMKMFLFFEDYAPSTELQVIGNIYQNPELIGV